MQLPKNIKAIFFDAGHTLIYAHPSVGELYAEETAKFGVTLPADRLEQAMRDVFRGYVTGYAQDPRNRVASDERDYEMWREITRGVYDRFPELSGVDPHKWFLALYDRFAEPEVWRYYPDVKPSIRALRGKGLRLGVISNWDTRLRRIVEETGLTELVDFILISAEAGVRKPYPEIFERALENAGVQPDEAVHVGDLLDEDVAGARAVGIHPVLIDRNQYQLRPDEPDLWVIESLQEIVDALP